LHNDFGLPKRKSTSQKASIKIASTGMVSNQSPLLSKGLSLMVTYDLIGWTLGYMTMARLLQMLLYRPLYP